MPAHWIFDLDGTLTVAVHDFDALRRELGLPPGRPLLEAVAERPPAEADALRRRLHALERELVAATGPADGAHALLTELRARDARLGILTRNARDIALDTLRHCDLDAFFDPRDVIGRDEAAPKPSPAGIERLLAAWSARPDDAVMLGDFRFDLEAGRAAGVATMSVDPSGAHPWRAWADRCVDSLSELLDASRGG